MPTEADKILKFTQKQFIVIIFSLVSATFSLTTIYNTFKQQGIEMKEIEEDLIYERGRTDRKLKQLKEYIDEEK